MTFMIWLAIRYCLVSMILEPAGAFSKRLLNTGVVYSSLNLLSLSIRSSSTVLENLSYWML